MSALYIFAAAVGIPLLAWFLFGGSEDGADGGAGDDGIGGVMLRLLPLSSLAIALAAFGVCGLALGIVGAGSGVTLLTAVAAGVSAGALNSATFAYLRRSESDAGVPEERLAGSIGRVVLPIAEGHRGRVAISAGGQQVYLSAELAPAGAAPPGGGLETGAPVLVVEVRRGIATVARLDPELS